MRPLLERKQPSERKDTDWLGDQYLLRVQARFGERSWTDSPQRERVGDLPEEESNLFWEVYNSLAVPYESWQQLANIIRD